jgi:mono/diheme cytochrome c family protein
LKKAILSTIILLGSTSLLADTTMCFKENHQSMATIENTPLDGGVCAGKNTVNQMKAKGWSVDDIKISQTATGMSFIYILKNGVVPTATTSFTGNQAQMEANIIAKLEKKKEEEIKAKEIQEVQEAAIDGEKIYTNKCQTCHGANGEKSAYNSARPLKSLSVEDMQESIKNYKNGRVDSSTATIMTPYASYLDSKIVQGIHAYLNKINNK